MTGKWLKIIGIGEDGLTGLSDSSRIIIENAEHIFGGRRHLDMLPKTTTAVLHSWKSPLLDSMADLREVAGKHVVVLASGDPMCHGIGVTIGNHLGFDNLQIIPSLSAYSLAAARMGWPLTSATTDCLTLHGRPLENLTLHLRNNARLIILSADGSTPSHVAELLTLKGYGNSPITVFSHMGGKDEKTYEAIAKSWDNLITEDLNVICVSLIADHGVEEFSLLAGLPDDAYSHDGKLTKREIRAATLALLAPLPDQLLWDVGTGCGSIAIEWMRAGGRAIAIEDQMERLAMAADNALSLGTPALKFVEGRAPTALERLPTPNAIFIGGGLTSPGLVDACFDALPTGGRLVANAVTLQGEAKLMDMHERFGGEMSRQSVSRLVKVGPHHGWKPFMQVTQYLLIKK
ncbi:MAG: precorrin-6y C5,15-methyltransferase (decarboxylating) subunit CbiE [Alphaproteobacteria bacterium]|nr:precorrin-6y C5,15-methyltransferase (decarboxylating) subunit CbiE [Alphaproteobacteria bacterium]